MHRTVRVAALVGALLASLLAAPSPAQALSSQPSFVLASPDSDQVTIVVGDLRKDLTLQPTAQVLVGKFTSNGRDGSAFLYNPGGGTDGLLTWRVTGGTIDTTFTPMPVAGRYRPLVQDFDLDGTSDILWYAPGNAADSIWWFDDGTHTKSEPSMGGDAQPVAVRGTGNSVSLAQPMKVIFYAPGSAVDTVWTFQPGSRTPSTSTLTINGPDYVPLVGFFDGNGIHPGRGILWYSPSGPEYLWVFSDDLGGYTSTRIADQGPGARPVVGGYAESNGLDPIFWYRPGAPLERVWTFEPRTSGGPIVHGHAAGSIRGDYRIKVYGGVSILLYGRGTIAQVGRVVDDRFTVTTRYDDVPPNAVGGSTWIDVPG